MPKTAKDWLKEAWKVAKDAGEKVSKADDFCQCMADYLEDRIFNYTDEVADTNDALIYAIEKALDVRLASRESLRRTLSSDRMQDPAIFEIRDILEDGLRKAAQ